MFIWVCHRHKAIENDLILKWVTLLAERGSRVFNIKGQARRGYFQFCFIPQIKYCSNLIATLYPFYLLFPKEEIITGHLNGSIKDVRSELVVLTHFCWNKLDFTRYSCYTSRSLVHLLTKLKNFFCGYKVRILTFSKKKQLQNYSRWFNL